MRFKLFNHSDIPEKYRSNFIHLYLDIAWFGVLSGTAVSFLNVYATQLGASGCQIGLLAAMSSGIIKIDRVIPHISISIKTLHPARNNRIRLGKSPQ